MLVLADLMGVFAEFVQQVPLLHTLLAERWTETIDRSKRRTKKGLGRMSTGGLAGGGLAPSGTIDTTLPSARSKIWSSS